MIDNIKKLFKKDKATIGEDAKPNKKTLKDRLISIGTFILMDSSSNVVGEIQFLDNGKLIALGG